MDLAVLRGLGGTSDRWPDGTLVPKGGLGLQRLGWWGFNGFGCPNCRGFRGNPPEMVGDLDHPPQQMLEKFRFWEYSCLDMMASFELKPLKG